MEFIETGDDIAWVEDSIDHDESLVIGNVPAVFESYARVLHPPKVRGGPVLTWAELAGSLGVEMRPTVRWAEIAERLPGLDHGSLIRAPEVGQIPEQVFGTLIEALSNEGPVPWYFGFSTGRTWFRQADVRQDEPSGLANAAVAWNAGQLPTLNLTIPGREYALVRGVVTSTATWRTAVREIGAPFLMPDVLWPVTRRWFIAVGMDFDSSLIGGPRDLVAHISATDGLEVLGIRPEESLSRQL